MSSHPSVSFIASARGSVWLDDSPRDATHERRDELTSDFPTTATLFRDHVVMWSKDLQRTVESAALVAAHAAGIVHRDLARGVAVPETEEQRQWFMAFGSQMSKRV